ncbi:Re/Si-specific NAD(P)(+) transhydrogenase subunit alpha [Rhodococcus opacus]|uniref:Re/Si-specific NAD(P)(+) transhydrogenase subunit alpha n=1 Tax=Rhodococcus opacus TaxID=37919 RepID=UPI002475D83F|nr:Re/Si-specific NAD(P)(+) transhydrogenase subunit alpha [Rhodococcus opacus]MDH6291324.1 NAD(P) transhydrogenase subunit alpha [Rhodococcus opacus]
MIVGVLREAQNGEQRVAATPSSVTKLLALGYDVVVDAGAGDRAAHRDETYRDAGAVIGDACAADIVLGVNPPSPEQRARLRPGVTVVGIFSPAANAALLQEMSTRRVTVLAMDAVPRISRAQSLDVLSSMANIAGYRAVIEAAHAFGRFFTGQVTAAGKVPPATVLIAGAGVAGLSAIAAAGSLGAIVLATDPRPEVADQVRSLGGEYLAVPDADVAVSTTGYASEVSEDYAARAARMYAAQLPSTDVLITTALVPGRPAPRLVTADMVATMPAGSVVVDMAAASGGNVEGTVAGEAVVTRNGVTILGYTDLAGRLPAQASQLYGTNVVNLLALLTPVADGQMTLDLEDQVQRSITVVHNGSILWPPPPVHVTATPLSAEPAAPAPRARLEPKRTSSAARVAVPILVAVLLFLITAAAPPVLRTHLTVFTLAVVIGFYVIGSVHHALHTPLMSVTNAISGIIVVGAILQMTSSNVLVTALAGVAVLVAAINVVGGFAVTRRMLGMFHRESA